MESEEIARKRLRVGHVSERGGINAVRTLLESRGLVVDEVDGRADYGRDLNVDITAASRITGGIIGVQVTGGSSFYQKGRWAIPATPTDWGYWRASTVPVIGMTWDPATNTIHWVNLTQRARSRVHVPDGTYAYEIQDDAASEVVAEHVLDNATFASFIEATERYLEATSSTAFIGLLSDDDDARRRAVYACWTLGRADPAPLILLRRLLPGLNGRSLWDGITALAHATPHPDIGWNSRNWISEPVKREIAASMRWSPSELVSLVNEVEQFDEEILGWERGGVGQSLWSIMVMDPEILSVLRLATRLAADEGRLDAASRLLICYQWMADEPLNDVLALLDEVPQLRSHHWVPILLGELEEHGRIDVY